MFDLFCNVLTFTLYLQKQRIFYISMLSLIHPFYLLSSDAYFCQFIFLLVSNLNKLTCLLYLLILIGQHAVSTRLFEINIGKSRVNIIIYTVKRRFCNLVYT